MRGAVAGERALSSVEVPAPAGSNSCLPQASANRNSKYTITFYELLYSFFYC